VKLAYVPNFMTAQATCSSLETGARYAQRINCHQTAADRDMVTIDSL